MMMRTMRRLAKWIMLVVAVAFVGWMVFEVGMDATGQGRGTATDAIARVNGTRIDVNTYYQALREEQAAVREQLGSAPMSLEEQRALEDRVLQRLVDEALLQGEFRRRGIRVTDQEIREWALSRPPPELVDHPQFQTDGQFDIEKYQRFLASGVDPGMLYALEERYRLEIPRTKLFDQITSDVFVSDARLWRTYRDRHDSVTAVVLAMNPHLVAPENTIQLTDVEIQAYYDRNRHDFEQPATAFMSYVSISRRLSAADSAAALARAGEIRQEILAGADFGDVARRESADVVSGVEGGDLGEAGLGQFVPEFERGALALRPGQLSEPVLSPFGYHIIRLESRRETAFHARHILIPIELSGDHLDEVEAQADILDLHGAEQDDPRALDRVAERLGIPIQAAQPLPRGGRLPIGEDIVGDAGIWAFGPAEPGQTSPVVETDFAYYVFRLDSLRAAGIPPLAEVREQVRQAAVRARQLEMTRETARTIAQEVAQGSTLEQAGRRRGLSAITAGPFARVNPPGVLVDALDAVGLAFGLGIGETGGPVHTDVASYLVRPVRRVPADSAQFVAQLDELRLQGWYQARQERLQLVLTSLRERARIDDRRADIERAQREAERRAPMPSPLGF